MSTLATIFVVIFSISMSLLFFCFLLSAVITNDLNMDNVKCALYVFFGFGIAYIFYAIKVSHNLRYKQFTNNKTHKKNEQVKNNTNQEIKKHNKDNNLFRSN